MVHDLHGVVLSVLLVRFLVPLLAKPSSEARESTFTWHEDMEDERGTTALLE
jgi:hypothetical protein